jgi:hypothetical protein
MAKSKSKRVEALKYIRQMTLTLADLAMEHNSELLAYLLHMAYLEAEDELRPSSNDTSVRASSNLRPYAGKASSEARRGGRA